MNHWTKLSIEYATQKSYLDDLFSVYPTIPEGIRDVNQINWGKVQEAFDKQDNTHLVKSLLKMDLFPIKDSYVAYLKRDPQAIDRNPRTINRLGGRLYEMGLDKIYERCTEPKETNRQIGPFFRRWLNSGVLGVKPVLLSEFMANNDDAILDAGDAQMMNFARTHLNYNRVKGLDFVGRFNGKYVIGEAKFLTDFGGHQNAQFSDAISTITASEVNAIMIAILDGVVYIPRGKMYNDVVGLHGDKNIMSSLVLREFLYQI